MPKTRKNHTKSRSKSRTKSRTKVKYYMKGCSRKNIKGGNPIVGKEWTSEHGGNYYPLNKYEVDTPLMMQVAGKRRRHKGGYNYDKNDKNKHKGGGFLNDLGRDAKFNLQSVGSILSATKTPVNPAPYQQFIRLR